MGSRPTASSVNPAFRYLGIPQSWLQSGWKPRLPSHKTSAFLLISTSFVTLYAYDRHQCRKLRQEYLRDVQHLSETIVPSTPDGAKWLPRRVTVYGARIPEDVDVDRGAQWFKKYVKPFLIAAAVDYRIENGTSPGALGRKIASDIQDERVIRAAQEKDGFVQPPISPGMPGYQSWHYHHHRLEGANIILGRASLKEYLWGLKKGYGQPLSLDGLEDEERLARHLENIGLFDEAALSHESDESFPEGLRGVTKQMKLNDQSLHTTQPPTNDDLDPNHPPASPPSGNWTTSFISLFKPRQHNVSLTPDLPLASTGSRRAVPTILSPSPIPEQPPLLLVPFDHPIGMIWWPLKFYRFFNRRAEVQKGAEMAISLIDGNAQPINPPCDLSALNDYSGWKETECKETDDLDVDFSIKMTGSSHLDFLCPQAEQHLRRSFKKAAKNIHAERLQFREDLKPRLVEARNSDRSLEGAEARAATGTVTEVQLRQEVVRKEKKWRNDLEGWKVVRTGSGVCWDPGMAQSLKIYTPEASLSRDANTSTL